jgi:hypothetical protein
VTKGRRKLRFDRLEDVLDDVDTLLAGHRTVGRWSLAQILNHLSNSIGYTIDGFPGRTAPWLIRKTLGAGLVRLMLATRYIAEGVKLPAEYQPVSDDLAAEVNLLREAIARFAAASEPLAIHPFIGSMSHRRWVKFHCIHCAHHLSFAVPVSSPVAA